MTRSTFALALLLTLVLSAAASAQKERFAGTFVAADANTRGIARIAIYGDDTINVWGRCHPSDCDWGIEAAVAYGPSVDSDVQASAKVLTATYVQRHAVTVLVIRPLKGGSLSVEAFTRFTDRSRRAAVTAREILVRENPVQQ